MSVGLPAQLGSPGLVVTITRSGVLLENRRDLRLLSRREYVPVGEKLGEEPGSSAASVAFQRPPVGYRSIQAVQRLTKKQATARAMAQVDREETPTTPSVTERGGRSAALEASWAAVIYGWRAGLQAWQSQIYFFALPLAHHQRRPSESFVRRCLPRRLALHLAAARLGGGRTSAGAHQPVTRWRPFHRDAPDQTLAIRVSHFVQQVLASEGVIAQRRQEHVVAGRHGAAA